jgi:hypothetical protein
MPEPAATFVPLPGVPAAVVPGVQPTPDAHSVDPVTVGFVAEGFAIDEGELGVVTTGLPLNVEELLTGLPVTVFEVPVGLA